MALIRGAQIATGTNGIATANLADSAVTSLKLAAGSVDNANKFGAGVVDSAALGAAAVIAGKIATGGVSAAGQFAAGVVDATALATSAVTTVKILDNNVTDGKLATAVQNILPDRLKASSMVVVKRDQALGTTQPLSLLDATMSGKTAGGSVNGSGTAGVVASSFATAAAETGTAATQAGLGSAAAAAQPYNATDFAGQNRVVVRLQKADGDDPVLKDMLTTASGADVNAAVYGYLSYRSDLAADLKWRIWFYYRRASDGLETPFTPDTALTNATVLVPEVFLLKDLPVKHGIGGAAVGSQAAAAIGAGGVGTTELAALAVTTAKIAAGAVTTAELGAAAVTTAKIAAGAVTTTELGAAAVTTAKIAASAVTTTELGSTSVTAAKLGSDVSGNGLAGGNGAAMTVKADDMTGGANLAKSVNVSANGVAIKIDDATIGEGASLRLAVKAGGIGENELATASKPKPVTTDKAQTCAVTTANYDLISSFSGGTGLASTPARDGYVMVTINGLAYEVGDALRTRDVYFSADAGVTARSIAAITAGDKVYKGEALGFNTAATDKLDAHYMA